MLTASTVLRTKLHPPRIQNMINREKFTALFTRMSEKRLTTVTAGPGFGKTTLVANALKNHHQNTVWYRLGRTDADLTIFLNYISEGIKNIRPSFGSGIIATLNDSDAPHAGPDALMALFINELSVISNDPLYIVLDDYHLISENEEIRNCLMFFLSHLPEQVHLVLISRLAIPLPLSRLKTMREMLDITQNDLAFDLSETRTLLLDFFKIRLNRNQLEIVFDKTKGWVSGLILLFHMVKEKSEEETAGMLTSLKGSMDEFYWYMEENIFHPLAPHEKDFVVKTAILSKMSPDLCNSFLGIANSDAILTKLNAHHLFTISLEGEKNEYVYHDLFKGFLLSKLKARADEKALKSLHATIAELHEKDQEYTPALDHYLKAGRMADFSRMIAIYARLWIKKGSIGQIRHYLNQVPASFIKEDPWIQFLSAGFMELTGRLEKASAAYEKALNLFREQGMTEGLQFSLMEVGLCAFRKGHFEKAEPFQKELLGMAAAPPFLKVICLGYLIRISYQLDKPDESDHYAGIARSVLAMVTDQTDADIVRGALYLSISRRLLLAGRLKESLDMTIDAQKLIRKTGQHRLIADGHLSLAEIYFKLGRYDHSIQHADRMIQMMKDLGILEPMIPYAHLFKCYSLHALNHEDARSSAEKAISMSQEGGNKYTQCLAHVALAMIQIDAGDLLPAKRRLDMARACYPHASPLVRSMVEIFEALLMTENRQFPAALECLSRAEKRTAHFRWQHAMALFCIARCHAEADQMDKALAALETALAFCEKNGYDAMATLKKEWTVPLLAQLYAVGKRQAFIRQILSDMGPDALAGISQILPASASGSSEKQITGLFDELRQALSPGLKIHMFGLFKVYKDDKALPLEKWASKKAVHLLKYLAFSRTRGFLNKEVLMELIWPDEDPAKSANRLHVVLAFLRKSLEPNLTGSLSSAYILSNGGAYRLNIGKHGWVDIEAFSQAIEKAKTSKNPDEAHSSRLKAVALYAGDFLEDDPYSEWTRDIRDRFKKDFLDILYEIIRYHESDKAYDQSIHFGEKYLNADKYNETVYRILMRCHSHMGNRSAAINTYRLCKRSITEELNCALDHRTAALSTRLQLT